MLIMNRILCRINVAEQRINGKLVLTVQPGGPGLAVPERPLPLADAGRCGVAGSK